MKELCKPKDGVGCVASHPRQWPETSSSAVTAISVESHLSWEKITSLRLEK